ncbi:hypothetical protein [Bythopirellula goksoeyrii]|uniref:Uncharacterized protein n=1 Tax=Bythopirellula goksoeyrii TaxID=1400387 RepID=A0A5B9QMT0_9BACT|nr:hypothetical protein [Bythopirellula goksoeyrii]QEG35303.1 hypothetical protein Pr1d_25990 [Bythopirellula goksoeyrii]
MVAGLGLLLASGLGIVCGWQPMPDGDASYECVIQLEPELVGTLKDGGSIPLSVDIPEHVRPIKRVRIIVGSGQVPQQSLLTNLKPWPGEGEKQSREGVVEAQYRLPNNSGDDRYHTSQQASQPVLPPGGSSLSSPEAFAQSLQNGGEAANQMSQDVLPPDPGRSISDAVDRTSQQMSSEIRNVGDSVNSNIRQLFGGEPTSVVAPPQSTNRQNSQVLPPGSSPLTATENRNTLANNGQTILPPDGNTTVDSRPVEPPVSTNQGRDWQSSGSPPGFAASNSSFGAGQSSSRTMQPGATPSTFSTGKSSVLPQNERYGNSIQPPQSSGFDVADNRNDVSASIRPTESGPGFPDFKPTSDNNLGLASPTTPASRGQSNVPEINRGMLARPANAELQGANGQSITLQNSISSPTAGSQTTQPPAQQSVAQAAANPTAMFPLLLSWVLLSGSGAGNLYLFWSYLDIRNKYRDVLYDASRKLTGRGSRD